MIERSVRIFVTKELPGLSLAAIAGIFTPTGNPLELARGVERAMSGGLWFPASMTVTAERLRVRTSLIDRLIDGTPRVNVDVDLRAVTSVRAVRRRFGLRWDVLLRIDRTPVLLRVYA